MRSTRRRLRAKAVAQPFRTYQQPLRLTRGLGGDYRRTIVAADDIRPLLAAGIPRFQAFLAPPWHVRELATGHWPMLSMPDELAALLDDLAVTG